MCVFYGQKDSMRRIFIKNFLLCSGKCLSRKAVHNWVANVSEKTKRLKRRWVVIETTVKMLLRCGFRRTGKAIGQVYQCWWRICRETNVLRSMSICDLFTDSWFKRQIVWFIFRMCPVRILFGHRISSCFFFSSNPTDKCRDNRSK
jgi:hypothetical protein